MERWVDKVIAIIVTFLIPFFFTMLPYAIHGYITSKGELGRRIICYLMCFGGGIFFGTFLLHMGPETRATLDTLLFIPNDITYPVTDLIIGIGFFSVLLLEKSVMRINKRKMQKHQKKLEANCLVFQERLIILRKCEQMNNSDDDSKQKMDIKTPKLCRNCKEGKPCCGLTPNGETAIKCDEINNNGNSKGADVTMVAIKKIDTDAEVTEFGASVIAINGKVDKSPCYDYGSVVKQVEFDLESLSSCSSDSSHDSHNEQGHHEMRSLILVLALSLHHLFEGLSIGLQPTATLLWTLVFAVMCHESIISFSVGLNFTKCKYSLKKHLLTAFLVCLIMPIGEAIGTIMSEVGSESKALDIASGFLQAFSSGTFLFVTFFEIFQEEIDPHDTSLGKIASAFAGYVVMALLMMIPESSPQSSDPTTVAYTVTESMTSMMTETASSLLGFYR